MRKCSVFLRVNRIRACERAHARILKSGQRHESFVNICALRLYTFILVSIFLTGCGSSEDEALAKYIHDVKSRPVKRVEPLPDFKPMAMFVFPEDTHRRSPFKPKPIAQVVDVYAPNLSRKKEPLEEFPLDALKLVGTFKQNNEIWGLIQEPNKFVAKVKVGDYMGQNYGLVNHIDIRAITVEERIRINGRWEKRKIVINLKQSS